MNQEKRYVLPPYESQFQEITGEGSVFDFEEIIKLNARCLAQIIAGLIEEGKSIDGHAAIYEREVLGPLRELVIAGEVARADVRKILGLGNGIDLQE